MGKGKFSVPYNGAEPTEYLKALEPYKENIDHIYFGVGYLGGNHHNIRKPKGITQIQFTDDDIKMYEEFTHRTILQTKGIYKRIITLNSGYYGATIEQLYNWAETILFPYIEITEIDGCICTDYNMARIIHENFPNLEIHTSCNCFQWNIRQMELWRENCGVTVFNPPREILRSPYKLKEMHDYGFKIKAIVNESCLFGCPQTIEHCMAVVNGDDILIHNTCNRGDISNFFKCNWVLPRWLDILDEYVDIYKLSGRLCTLEYLKTALNAFINRLEVEDVTKIFNGANTTFIKDRKIKIPSTIIPDRLLTCECKECNKTCFVCKNLIDLCISNSKYNESSD